MTDMGGLCEDLMGELRMGDWRMKDGGVENEG